MSSSSSSNGHGISLQVTVYLAPENVPKFLEYFKPVFDNVTAEPKCKFFELYQSAEEPGTLSWVEDWYVFTPSLRETKRETHAVQGRNEGMDFRGLS
jgi:hypothetical protein